MKRNSRSKLQAYRLTLLGSRQGESSTVGVILPGFFRGREELFNA